MRVYIIDDDPLIRRMIARMIAGEEAQWEEFGSAAAFLEALDTLPIGCVLLDIGLPDQHGLEVLNRIVARRPFPVVMVSGSSDVNDAIGSFRGGAMHFIRKPFSRQQLLDTLAEAWTVGLERTAAAEREAAAGRIRLTAREKTVLEAMTRGHQTKLTAWQLGLSVRTVEMHRSNILTKLGARNVAHAVAITRSLHLLPEAASLA
ncbi:response regulator [Sphingomonas sp. AAP5]|uniref:response regulator transcription factor n=1 Tax=Sphingomonas sp. AAP5 TaxID=1523415 RepID=UPI001056FE98|nr:response regulator [Sphingomonas sp. AAP5]QBM77496.1 response regulator [Sphingomonas sp. AAP5]